MDEINLPKIVVFWEHAEPDGSACGGCKKVITSIRMRMLTQVGEADALRINDTGLQLCEDCFVKLYKEE